MSGRNEARVRVRLGALAARHPDLTLREDVTAVVGGNDYERYNYGTRACVAAPSGFCGEGGGPGGSGPRPV